MEEGETTYMPIAISRTSLGSDIVIKCVFFWPKHSLPSRHIHTLNVKGRTVVLLASLLLRLTQIICSLEASVSSPI